MDAAPEPRIDDLGSELIRGVEVTNGVEVPGTPAALKPRMSRSMLSVPRNSLKTSAMADVFVP